MYQRWRDLTFLHWRCDAPSEIDALARRLPPGLVLDRCDGSAWLGITPFLLDGLRPPGVPPVPWLSRFPECNVRTYVRGRDGAPGIWFFSLECARLPAVVAARSLYGLPYRWARMRVRRRRGEAAYWSERAPACLHVRAVIGRPVEADPLLTFLTARFRLYAQLRGRLAYADIRHAPWPLASARVTDYSNTLAPSLGFALDGPPPLVHFSPGVHVRIGAPVII